MKIYDVLTVTKEGVELWKDSLSYEQAKAEIESAKAEFGGKYWMEPAKKNPLQHIPDIASGSGDWR